MNDCYDCVMVEQKEEGVKRYTYTDIDTTLGLGARAWSESSGAFSVGMAMQRYLP